MALFVSVCIDKPGSLALRQATREAHVQYVRAEPGKMKLAGPFLDEAGEMCGSLIIFEAPDLAAARAWAEADPYQRAGLFERAEVRPWKATIGTLA